MAIDINEDLKKAEKELKERNEDIQKMRPAHDIAMSGYELIKAYYEKIKANRALVTTSDPNDPGIKESLGVFQSESGNVGNQIEVIIRKDETKPKGKVDELVDYLREAHKQVEKASDVMNRIKEEIAKITDASFLKSEIKKSLDAAILADTEIKKKSEEAVLSSLNLLKDAAGLSDSVCGSDGLDDRIGKMLYYITDDTSKDYYDSIKAMWEIAEKEKKAWDDTVTKRDLAQSLVTAYQNALNSISIKSGNTN